MHVPLIIGFIAGPQHRLSVKEAAKNAVKRVVKTIAKTVKPLQEKCRTSISSIGKYMYLSCQFTYLARLTTDELVHIHVPNSPNAKSNEGEDWQAGSARVRIALFFYIRKSYYKFVVERLIKA